jgi:hypothetical protein
MVEQFNPAFLGAASVTEINDIKISGGVQIF